jgi:hypothetical protein
MSIKAVPHGAVDNQRRRPGHGASGCRDDFNVILDVVQADRTLELLDIPGVRLDGQDFDGVAVARGRLERENAPVCPDIDEEIPGLEVNIKEAPGWVFVTALPCLLLDKKADPGVAQGEPWQPHSKPWPSVRITESGMKLDEWG